MGDVVQECCESEVTVSVRCEVKMTFRQILIMRLFSIAVVTAAAWFVAGVCTTPVWAKAREAAAEPSTTGTTGEQTLAAKKEDADTDKPLDLPGEEKTVDIPEPDDPVAKKAFHVLDKHCARCHQDGRLNRLKPAKNFGNVLKLDEIARDPNFILPGNPDGSPLYIQMIKQEMPYDVFQEFSGGDEPTEEELEVVRSWIDSIGAATVASCKERDFIDNEDIAEAIAEDLKDEPKHRREGMRYVTLTHLYNACASDEEMNVYRQGVVKLLNSLSKNSDVLKLATADDEETIIKFHIDDLKWDEEQWELIEKVYPYAVKFEGDDAEFVAETTDTETAWVRGDWLAYTASRPPLYNELLKLPETFGELQKELDLDVDDNIENNRIARAGFQNSLVSRNNRLIERHTISTGVFWTSYDFAGNHGAKNLFERPLGPDADSAFEHDGGETVFSLPNGFNGYYLNTAKGDQLDHGPTTIVQDVSQKDLRVTNGISCFGCHNNGFRKATDEIREHVLADTGFSEKVRERVAALYPPVEEMNKLLDQDFSRFRSALRRAGIDPDLKLNGVEIINALSQRYEHNVDLRLAAAEFGLTSDELVKALGAGSGEAFRVKRRLEQGTVPRDTFEARFSDLVATVLDKKVAEAIKLAAGGDLDVAKVGEKSSEETGTFELALISNKSDYKVDDLPVFTVKSEEKCYLTLINVDSNGNGTVIFPNKFQQDNAIESEKEFKFPADDAKFQFRLQDRGTETVIAVCNATGKSADGIKHDYKTRGFTPLGNYRRFLTRQIVVAGHAKVEAGKKAKEVEESSDKDYGVAAKDDEAEEKKTVKEDTEESDLETLILARTAIKFKVK
jgi:hypothetical protein